MNVFEINKGKRALFNSDKWEMYSRMDQSKSAEDSL